jgi:hypothetical protein
LNYQLNFLISKSHVHISHKQLVIQKSLKSEIFTQKTITA